MSETITWNSAHGFDCSACGHSQHPCEHWKIFVATTSKAQPAESTASLRQFLATLDGEVMLASLKTIGVDFICDQAGPGWINRAAQSVSEYERGRRDGLEQAAQLCEGRSMETGSWFADAIRSLAATSGTPAEHNPARAPHNKFASLWCDACPRPASGTPAPATTPTPKVTPHLRLYSLFEHAKDCKWATPLPTGDLQFWGCDCGLDNLLVQLESYELSAQAAAPGGKEPADEGCICKGNWRSIVAKTDSLIGKNFVDERGEEWNFFGIVHGEDDYYYGMRGKGKLMLLSCVGSIEGHGYKPATHPLQDKPPRVPRKCQRCGADLPGSSSFSVCGGDCRKPQEQPPAAPLCESFDVEGIMTDYCTLTKGHIGPHWGKHWNWAAQDKPTAEPAS